MLIIDVSGVLHANLNQNMKFSQADYDEDLLRHMILNSLRSLKIKFRDYADEIVLACDSGNVWRKDYFSYYKAGRKTARSESSLDWNKIYTFFNKIIEEIKETFPYYVIKIDRLEADDIIAGLVRGKSIVSDEIDFLFSGDKKIMIVSNDKDMIQLQKYKGVTQYSPIKKNFVTTKTPELDLQLLILEGDGSDGIPNVMTEDDKYITGNRMKSLSSKKINEFIADWKDGDITKNMTETQKSYYHRNLKLIDLSQIPQEYISLTQTAYENYTLPTRSQGKIMQYFMFHRLRNLLTHINDF